MIEQSIAQHYVVGASAIIQRDLGRKKLVRIKNAVQLIEFLLDVKVKLLSLCAKVFIMNITIWSTTNETNSCK